MRRNLFILQNNVLGMDYKLMESRIYSFVVLIWGIFILVRLRTLAVKKSYKLVEKHLNIPGDNFGMFIALLIKLLHRKKWRELVNKQHYMMGSLKN